MTSGLRPILDDQYKLTPLDKKNLEYIRKWRHSDNPKYMSVRGGLRQEYLIDRKGDWFVIKSYGKHNLVPKALQGNYGSHREAEEVLVRWIIQRDKFQESIYPKCPPLRRTSYTELFLKGYLRKQAHLPIHQIHLVTKITA